MKTIPNEMARQKFDIRASSADHDPCVSGRNVQAGIGLKPGVVVSLERDSKTILIIGGHVQYF